MITKKILILVLLFSYSFGVIEEEVYAQKSKRANSSKSNKNKSKSKSKSKSKKSARASSSNRESNSNTDDDTEEINNTETISSTYTETTTVVQEEIPTPVQQTVVANNTEPEQEEIATTESKTSEIPDMSKEAEWEDFKVCMQQNCAGGDEQPLNVECYKTLNFENAFSVCKDYILDETKVKDFKKYFSGPFIKQEKKAFCEGEIWNGKFNDANGKCAITVTFKRNKVDGKHHGCAKVSKTKTWYLDNKNYSCDGESVFNVSPCFHDSAQAESAKMQKYTAIASMTLGAVTGTIAGIASAKSYKETTTTTDKDGKAHDIVINNGSENKDADFGKRAVWSGIGEGWSAASGALTSGGTQLATAIMMEKEKGDREYGRCELPNGTILSEGNTIKLSW